jgi:hypothetical protein
MQWQCCSGRNVCSDCRGCGGCSACSWSRGNRGIGETCATRGVTVNRVELCCSDRSGRGCAGAHILGSFRWLSGAASVGRRRPLRQQVTLNAHVLQVVVGGVGLAAEH